MNNNEENKSSENIDKTVVINFDDNTNQDINEKTVVLNAQSFNKKNNLANQITKNFIDRKEEASSKKLNTSFFTLKSTRNISQIFEKQIDIDKHIKRVNTKEKINSTLVNNSEEVHMYNNVNDNFDTIAKLAEGGQGFISSAIDKKLGRVIAIKSLHENLINNSNARENFMTEAKITAQLDHPGVVAIYSLDSDQNNGLHLAMKLINGQNLSEYLDEIRHKYHDVGIRKFNEKKSIRYRIEVIIKCCEALSYAHSRNVMHCDLKPDNIMIGEYGETYIMDWGIAKLIKNDDANKSNTIAGTPYYFAPEIISQQEFDERADIYTLGLILFEAIYLKRAFSGKNEHEVLVNIKNYDINSFSHAFGFYIPHDLTAIIAKACAYNPSDRYQSMNEFSDDLRRFLNNEETKALPDNLISKTLRNASRHIKLLFIVTLAAILIGTCAVFYTVYNRIENSKIQLRQEIVLSDAYSKTLIATAKIAYQMSYVSQAIQMLASNYEFLATHKLSSNNITKNYIEGDKFATMHKEDKSFQYNKFYKQYISLSKLSYYMDARKSEKSANQILNNMQIFIPKFESIMNNSNTTLKQNDNDNILTGNSAILWLYYANDNGLFCLYPGYGNSVNIADVTQRSWYKLAKKNLKTSWGVPYHDVLTNDKTLTCSTPVFIDKKFSGVFAADLSMKTITNVIEKSGNSKLLVRNKMLINDNGEILINTLEHYDGDENYKDTEDKFADNEILDMMNKRKNGYIITKKASGKYVYLFNYIEQLKWFYVEFISYQKLMDNNVDEEI